VWAAGRETYSAVEVKSTMNNLKRGAVTAGLVIAFFLALTISVQFWLATTPPAGGSGAVVMAYPTPDPHP